MIYGLVDFGSTFTKLALVDGGTGALLATSQHPTTIDTDVFEGYDAALDETNVGRLADLLHSLSKETQFLLVTHSKRMMHAADIIVTKAGPGTLGLFWFEDD